jgi:hypothetical protein
LGVSNDYHLRETRCNSKSGYWQEILEPGWINHMIYAVHALLLNSISISL